MSLGVKDCRRRFRFSLMRYKAIEDRELIILLPIQVRKLNPNVDWWSTEIVFESQGIGSEMASLGCNLELTTQTMEKSAKGRRRPSRQIWPPDQAWWKHWWMTSTWSPMFNVSRSSPHAGPRCPSRSVWTLPPRQAPRARMPDCRHTRGCSVYP